MPHISQYAIHARARIKRTAQPDPSMEHAAYDATQQTSEQRGTPRYRGVAHPLCFTDEVLDHEFPEGFKPVNIEAYDGLRITSSISIWLEEMISMPSSTYHSSSKGQLGTGLKASPKTPLEAGKSSKTRFRKIFKGLMSDLRTRTI